MGLILPNGPAFAHWSDNLATAATTGLDWGTTLPDGGSANAAGSDVTVLDDLTHDCEYLVFAVYGTFSNSGVRANALLDILVDPTGGTSWSVLISDLISGWASGVDIDTGSTGYTPVMYAFPLWIPAGTAVGARIQGNWQTTAPAYSAPANIRLAMWAAGGNKNPASWWCGQKVETVGALDAANSTGQTVTPGASGSFSSWTSLGSAISARAGALQYAVGGAATPTQTSQSCRFEFGAGSNQIGPCVYRGCTSTETGVSLLSGPVFCDIPSGTQMQVRAASGSGSPQAIECAAYLVQ